MRDLSLSLIGEDKVEGGVMHRKEVMEVWG